MIEMKSTLIANVQTFSDIQAWGVGEQVLVPVFALDKLKPQRAATFGEVTAKRGFDVDALEDCQSHWASKATMRLNGAQTEFFEDFNWKRTKVVKSQGMVTFPSTNTKGTRLSGGLYFESQFRKEIDWRNLFEVWCLALSPYCALLHPSINLDQPAHNDRDLRDYSFDEEVARNAWSRFSSGAFHCEFRAGELNSLISGFTNLGWATFFGAKFVHEVDAAAISAAGFPIEKIGEGYLVQVTEDINDVVNDFAMFSDRRAELKSLFRDDLFLIKNEPEIA